MATAKQKPMSFGGSGLIIGVAALLIIVIAYYLLSNHPASNNLPSGSQVTVPGPGISTVSPSSPSGGSGNSFISQSEAASIMGSGGSYNWSSISSQSQIAELLSAYGPNSTAPFASNISAVYVMGYNINASTALLEAVFQTQSSKALYTSVLSYTNNTVTILNASTNGMTYSYIQGSSPIQFSNLVGWKGNEVAFVIATGKSINSTSLAATVAGDLT